MDSLLNPKIGGGNLVALTLLGLGMGAFLGAPRLMVAASQISNASIAATRVDQCRVLGGNDKLVLGGYYGQLTQDGRGEWLGPGTLLCDLYGGSGEIFQGGYLQFLVTTDPLVMNKKLLKRLEEKANPDSNPAMRPRRDPSVPIYQPPAATQENTQFTGELNG